MRNNTLVALTWVVLFLISYQVYLNAFWLHSHKSTSGSVYIHAHPFEKDSDKLPLKNHTHNKSDYFLFDQADLLFFSSIAAICLFAATTSDFKPAVNITFVRGFVCRHRLGRAPPMLLV